MIEINAQSVIDGLSAIVAEVGEDFVYRRGLGVYVDQGSPSCIVGHYLASVGVPLDRLSKADTAAPGGTSEAVLRLLGKLREEGVLTADSGAALILSAVQWRQDEGCTWGEALDLGVAAAFRN